MVAAATRARSPVAPTRSRTANSTGSVAGTEVSGNISEKQRPRTTKNTAKSRNSVAAPRGLYRPNRKWPQHSTSKFRCVVVDWSTVIRTSQGPMNAPIPIAGLKALSSDAPEGACNLSQTVMRMLPEL
mgnify:CR=1 FL=1